MKPEILETLDKQTLCVETPLPGLNELIAAAKAGRGKCNAYARLKDKYSRIIALYARSQQLRPINGKPYFVFFWIEPDRRRDPDNIAAGGRKIILDALTELGIITGDGWKHISGWHDNFEIDKKQPGVRIDMYGC